MLVGTLFPEKHVFFGKKGVKYLSTSVISKNIFFAFSSFLAGSYWKSIFWPMFGVCSTQTLVKIYNTNLLSLICTLIPPLRNWYLIHLQIFFSWRDSNLDFFVQLNRVTKRIKLSLQNIFCKIVKSANSTKNTDSV